MPAKSVHRSENQQATMVTLLKRTGRTLPGFSYNLLQTTYLLNIFSRVEVKSFILHRFILSYRCAEAVHDSEQKIHFVQPGGRLRQPGPSLRQP